ncbi:glycosyltransferase family 4 protein [Caballeronia sp. GAOx1]|uniref:glycosyltransferase family 4 protein n=1 Tax=Caballeronia sp. GAOx1 TaxID=2921761 RepID=UPI0020279ED5|nr:glycosyltransferase family 4 protein [Caballeronia sp. GAOx1]
MQELDVQTCTQLPEDFDPVIYLELHADVRNAGVDPRQHYVKYGRAEKREYRLPPPERALSATPERASEQPGDFDPAIYLELHSDLREAGVDPVRHYLEHGRIEKREYRYPPFEFFGYESFDPARETALVVTHECSLTGAPVLVYNIAQLLADSLNVVVLALGPGMLEPLFKELPIAYVPAHKARFSSSHAKSVIGNVVRQFTPAFAIVNSIESQFVVPPLKDAGVPQVSLIHEFAPCYPDPRERFRTMMTMPQQVVFSSQITFEDAARFVDDFDPAKIHILPQGRSRIPGKRQDDEKAQAERARLRGILRPDGDDARRYVVLGAGSVNFRKGVDLFLQCASRIAAKVGADKCRFVWIGHGYDPRHDPAYSVYLEDQILRAGLTESLRIIDETTEIETAYELSDLFLLSSRLDPLPNVAIDAMSFNKPLVCFDETTGVVSFLEQIGVKELCVAEYLNVEDLAEKASRLLLHPELRALVADTLASHVAESFSMARYVEQVVALVAAS